MTPYIVYAIWDVGSILCTERLTALAPLLGYNLHPHCPTAPLVSGPPSLPLLLPTTTPPGLFPAASFTVQCPGRLVRAREPAQGYQLHVHYLIWVYLVGCVYLQGTPKETQHLVHANVCVGDVL